MSLQAAYDAGFDLAMEKEAGIKDKLKAVAMSAGIMLGGGQVGKSIGSSLSKTPVDKVILPPLGALAGGMGGLAAGTTAASAMARRRRLDYLKSIKGNKKAKSAYLKADNRPFHRTTKGADVRTDTSSERTPYLRQYHEDKADDVANYINKKYRGGK